MQELISQVEELGIEINHTTSLVMIFGIIFITAIQRGIAILTYNRGPQIGELIEAVSKTAPKDTRIVVCDDRSTDDTPDIIREFKDIIYVRGPNLGVVANKNRALASLQDCHFLAIIEDDLFPQTTGWFEIYETVCTTTDIHHFCRVQDKEVEETVPEFSKWIQKHGYTTIYGPSPRGDLTFISARVLRKVGAFNPQFRGAGYGHGEWSERVFKSGLIPHPLKWVDVKEARDMFIQKGDREGGRWLLSKKKIKQQLKDNHALARRLRRSGYLHHPIVMQ